MRWTYLELGLGAAIVAFVGMFAIVPAGQLFAASVQEAGGASGIARVLGDPVNQRSLENSFLQGGLSASLAVAVGYLPGVFLGRYRWPGRSAVRSLLLVPFLLPSLIVVLGVLDLFGPSGVATRAVPALAVFGNGLPAIVAANLLFNVPIVVLLTATGCEASSSDLEETAASLGGSPARVYQDTWAGPTWVGAAAGGLLTFVFSALSFAPPLLLCGAGSQRCYTVEARVWSLESTLLQPADAGVLALVLLVLFLAPALAYLAMVRRIRPSPGLPASRSLPIPWRSPAVWAMVATTGAVLLSESALLAAVLYRSLAPPGGGALGASWARLFSPATGDRLGITIAGAVGNTLLFAVGAAVVTLLVGIAGGFVASRHRGFSLPLGLLLFVPLLLSPVVLAFGLASLWRPFLGGEANVWLLIVISQSMLALPLALQSVEIPLAGVPRAAAEAAESLGASRWGGFVDTELPRVRTGILTASLFAMAVGLGEFTATYFLVTPTFTTVPVAIYDLTYVRLLPEADAAAGLLLAVSLAVYVVIVFGGRRVEL